MAASVFWATCRIFLLAKQVLEFKTSANVSFQYNLKYKNVDERMKIKRKFKRCRLIRFSAPSSSLGNPNSKFKRFFRPFSGLQVTLRTWNSSFLYKNIALLYKIDNVKSKVAVSIFLSPNGVWHTHVDLNLAQAIFSCTSQERKACIQKKVFQLYTSHFM